MKTRLLILLTSIAWCCGGTAIVAAQESDSVRIDDPYFPVDVMPTLIDGYDSLMAQVKYPDTQADVEGRVFVIVTVDKDGSVSDVRVGRGLGPGFDEEALRVARLARYTPGEKNGKPVRVQMSLPIRFGRR